jgi:hypothetical protein
VGKKGASPERKTMEIEQYLLLRTWEEIECKKEWEFPRVTNKDFWEYALYHVKMMTVSEQGSRCHLIAHLELELDDYLKLKNPNEWLYWLFQEHEVYTANHEAFNMVYRDHDGQLSLNWEMPSHEFLIQKSERFPGKFEIYDLTENEVIHIEDTDELCNQWLDNQFVLAKENELIE